MARSQMLYIGDKGQMSYPAAGNIEMNDGSAGTVALWYHPMDKDQWANILIAGAGNSDHLLLARDQSEWKWRSRRNGSAQTLLTVSDDLAWRFVVATWDFTGAPGEGVLRLYLDGEEVPESPLTGVPAPATPPETIEVGPGEDNTRSVAHAVYDHLTIRDRAMSAQEVADLHAEGRHHRAGADDASGRLLFAASWDEQYDAEIAEGSGTATPGGAADQYCRLDCRSRHDGKRFSYHLGMPAHDGSDDDRVPLHAVLTPLRAGNISVTNEAEYARLDVNADGLIYPTGACYAPWMPTPEGPMTLRVGLHVDSIDGPNGAPVAVGAQEYITGKLAQIQAGQGCTQSEIVSSGLTQEDGYWAGAELHVLTGAASGQKMKVADSSQAGTSLTIEGQLGSAPAEGDSVAVIEPWRVEPAGAEGREYRLECDLEEVHSGVERFAVLETAVIGYQGYTRYNGGRIQYFPYPIEREDIFFGKRHETAAYDRWRCTMYIDRLEMDGPMAYEETRRADDAFMVLDPESGESVRAARTENVQLELRRPDQHPDPEAVKAAIRAPGTWRETFRSLPRCMSYDAENDRLQAVLVGLDSDGVERLGYIHGTWNETEGLVEWEDDPDPRNPFLLLDDLRAVLGGRSSITNVFAAMGNVYEVSDDNWALQFTAGIGSPDGVVTCVLEGAPDRYSFDPQRHFDRTTNPLTPTMSGDDKVVPEGGGIGLFGNRDCELLFVENPWARRGADRFWGCGRAKTLNNRGALVDHHPRRPLTCAVTGDFRNVRHVPWPNQVIAPASGWFHWPHPQWFHPSTVGLVVDDGAATTSHVGLWVAEDGVHYSRIMSVIERNTPPYDGDRMMPVSNAPRLGDRRVYWYRDGYDRDEFNLASIRLGGEAVYLLADDAVQGELETCTLVREEARWQDLRLNADPKGGSVTVAVLEAETGGAVPGYSHADCDGIVDDVEQRVTWNGIGLPEVGDARVRLEFRLTRTGTEAASPELYEWMIGALLVEGRPMVTAVEVEGQINPVSVANAEPELAWAYEERGGGAQSAYQVLVSSTQAKLDANEGDLWDSGVVLSEEPVAKYAGESLGSAQTYFWKVRVRDSEGVWSEEW
ncbi:MAG: LamG domain-containing protein [Armatimonadota bacterium]